VFIIGSYYLFFFSFYISTQRTMEKNPNKKEFADHSLRLMAAAESGEAPAASSVSASSSKRARKHKV
jgi:hypothetical protein